MTDIYIYALSKKVVDVMSIRNRCFSIFQQNTLTGVNTAVVDAIVKTTGAKHVDLVKNATPKVHISEAHAVD